MNLSAALAHRWNDEPLGLDAERSILAAMMLDAAAIGRAAEMIDASAFYRTAHAKVYEALVALYNADTPADLITVSEALQRRGDLEVVGGPQFLAQLMEYATTSANIEQHVRIVREAAARRALLHAGLKLQEDSDDAGLMTGELLDKHQARLADISRLLDGQPSGQRNQIEFLDLDEVHLNGIPAVPWLVEGWVAEQDIVLVSGDGGIGKSTTVAAMAYAVATGGSWCGINVPGAGTVLVIDEEQSEREISRLFLRLGAPHSNLHIACQQGVNLTTPGGLRRLEEVLDRLRPTLTVLDSVQQVFVGTDGNNADAVAKVYAKLFRLRRLYSTTFVLIGHLRKPPAEGSQVSKLHLVHGSVAFGTQASTVWVATQPARGVLDLVQVKRRDSERTSLRVRYQTDGPDAPIVLAAEGPVEEQETLVERTQDFIVAYLANHGTAPTKRILTAAAEEKPPLAGRVVERALKHLVQIGRIDRPARGYYGLKQGTAS